MDTLSYTMPVEPDELRAGGGMRYSAPVLIGSGHYADAPVPASATGYRSAAARQRRTEAAAARLGLLVTGLCVRYGLEQPDGLGGREVYKRQCFGVKPRVPLRDGHQRTAGSVEIGAALCSDGPKGLQIRGAVLADVLRSWQRPSDAYFSVGYLPELVEDRDGVRHIIRARLVELAVVNRRAAHYPWSRAHFEVHDWS